MGKSKNGIYKLQRLLSGIGKNNKNTTLCSQFSVSLETFLNELRLKNAECDNEHHLA